MQKVRSSNLLSSTGQKNNSNGSNRQYSGKVPQRRPSGPSYVFGSVSSAEACCWQDREFSHRSGAFTHAIWAILVPRNL